MMIDFERIAKLKRSSIGLYRVIGVDKFDYTDWLVGEYDTATQAIKVAQEKSEAARHLASDYSIATVYYAYDPDGNYLGGDVWTNNEPVRRYVSSR